MYVHMCVCVCVHERERNGVGGKKMVLGYSCLQ